MTAKHILVVDDEIGIRELLSEILFDEGYLVHLAEDAEQARIYRSEHEPDLVLLDIWMPDTDGLALLKEWVEQDLLTMPVVMMSGHGTIETAVEATRVGAVDFLEKPIGLQKLLSTISKAINEGALTPPTESAEVSGDNITLKMGEQDQEFSIPVNLPLREVHEYFDAIYFDYHLRKEDGNVSRVAEKVGIERTHLYRKFKQLGVQVPKRGGGKTS
jgi:DNA-binding NtrC family response regulator